ncbi:MAG: hypothetical protein R3Y13_05910 [bacterium]
MFEKEDDEKSLKISTINKIKEAGLEVIHIIQRYGLTSEEAFAVESVLIDIYSLENLTNEVNGHSFDLGPVNAVTLEGDLIKVEYIETDDMQIT